MQSKPAPCSAVFPPPLIYAQPKRGATPNMPLSSKFIEHLTGK